jgi:AcrR family transcriptional regulator
VDDNNEVIASGQRGSRLAHSAAVEPTCGSMKPMSEESLQSGIAERLVQATVTLLAEQGPSAIKARTVAARAGMSTMVVYSHFGGIPELLNAVVDHGFGEIEQAFAQVPISDDPVQALFSMALAARDLAQANPHLYDAMFGLSTRATYRPAPERGARRSGHSPAFKAAFAHLTDACARLAASGRVVVNNPEAVAGALWSFVHGYITLELANHFSEFEDPVTQVLVPMGVTFAVGLGDDADRARASHERALALTRHRR